MEYQKQQKQLIDNKVANKIRGVLKNSQQNSSETT